MKVKISSHCTANIKFRKFGKPFDWMMRDEHFMGPRSACIQGALDGCLWNNQTPQILPNFGQSR